MSAQANPRVVGGFVIGAIALIVAGALALGTGDLFKETRRFVLFFEGSVGGLNVGAPVNFRGVPLGSVVDIDMVINAETLEILIPVVIETEPDAIREMKGVELAADPDAPIALQLVERGLRAQLVTQSLVTGQQTIEFDFHPDTPVKLTGIESPYVELPTIPSAFVELQRTLDSALEGLEKLLKSPELSGAISSLKTALDEIGSLAKNLDDTIQPATDDLKPAVEAARRAFEALADTFEKVDKEVDPTSTSLRAALDEARVALRQGRSTLRTVEGVAEPGSPLPQALDDLAAAARSIRNLTEYLERHPEALVQGKGGRR